MVKTLVSLCRVLYQIYRVRYGIEYGLDTSAFKIHNLSQDIQQMSGSG